MTYLNDHAEATRKLLRQAKTIAVVGHSDDPSRTSYQIAQFLRSVGYTVYPVNPTVTEIDGEPSYKTLADVPVPVDIVDVFRNSSHLPGVVDAAIAAGAKAVWAQLGVHDDAAVQRAMDAGLEIVTDRCIKIEYMRLGVGQR